MAEFEQPSTPHIHWTRSDILVMDTCWIFVVGRHYPDVLVMDTCWIFVVGRHYPDILVMDTCWIFVVGRHYPDVLVMDTCWMFVGEARSSQMPLQRWFWLGCVNNGRQYLPISNNQLQSYTLGMKLPHGYVPSFPVPTQLSVTESLGTSVCTD